MSSARTRWRRSARRAVCNSTRRTCPISCRSLRRCPTARTSPRPSPLRPRHAQAHVRQAGLPYDSGCDGTVQIYRTRSGSRATSRRQQALISATLSAPRRIKRTQGVSPSSPPLHDADQVDPSAARQVARAHRSTSGTGSATWTDHQPERAAMSRARASPRTSAPPSTPRVSSRSRRHASTRRPAAPRQSRLRPSTTPACHPRAAPRSCILSGWSSAASTASTRSAAPSATRDLHTPQSEFLD